MTAALTSSGIYTITNLVNGKMYIGSAVNIKRRFNAHLNSLKKGLHCNKHLQSAWDKYGETSFVFKKLLICAKDMLIEYEQRAIDSYDVYKNGYNQRPIANSNAGLKLGTPSDETKRKIALSQIGISKPALIGNTHTLGMKHTEETKAKMIESSKKRENKKPTLGMKHSQESRDMMSLSRIGNQNALGSNRSPEWKEMMSQKMTGKKLPPFTDEHRANMSASSKGKKFSDERKKNLSIAVKASWVVRKQKAETAYKLSDRDDRN